MLQPVLSEADISMDLIAVARWDGAAGQRNQGCDDGICGASECLWLLGVRQRVGV